jgi:hypothetical protein
MKVKKTELIAALEKAKFFTGKGTFAVAETVLIDGPAGKIFATDLISTAEIPCAFTEHTRQAPVARPPAEIPGEEFTADLNDLKKNQLEALAEYAGIDASNMKKKGQIVDAIVAASIESAQKDASAEPEFVTVAEQFCVCPLQLLKILKSLDKETEYVKMQISDFYQVEDDLLRTVEAATLNIDAFFQKLTVTPASEFPAFSYMENPAPDSGKFYVEIPAKNLAGVSVIKPGEREHTQNVFFDVENGNVVATDGTRLHALKQDFPADRPKAFLPIKLIAAACKIAKDENITFRYVPAEDNEPVMILNFSDMTVYSKSPEVDYPGYGDLLTPVVAEDVVVEKELFEKALTQNCQVSEEAIILTFNGGVSLNSSSSKGIYHRENVPFVEGGPVKAEVSAAYNPKKLLDGIKAMEGKVRFWIPENLSGPLLLKEGNLTAVVMPTKL